MPAHHISFYVAINPPMEIDPKEIKMVILDRTTQANESQWAH